MDCSVPENDVNIVKKLLLMYLENHAWRVNKGQYYDK